MTRQTFLVRRGARYHFRRRSPYTGRVGRPISIALNTADPVEARRLARRLAEAWDRKKMEFNGKFKRGTLTLAEAEQLFRQGLVDELARATAHLTAPIGADSGPDSFHKVMATALRIVSRVPPETVDIATSVIEAEIDSSWTDDELKLLEANLAYHVTPMRISQQDAADALNALGIISNDGLTREARSHILYGQAEAHRRAAFHDHPAFIAAGGRVSALLDDGLVGRMRTSGSQSSAPEEIRAPLSETEPSNSPSTIFAHPSQMRFSEIISETLGAIEEMRNLKPDYGQRRAIMERFAWITGDKPLLAYSESDVEDFVRHLRKIPNDFRWGKLHTEGAMALPYIEARIPVTSEKTLRSARTINRDLSFLQAVSERLAKSHWRLKYSKDIELNFNAVATKIEPDPAHPPRVPWTPQHLEVMYGLPLWRGSGAKLARLKVVAEPRIYQDGAYWVPLIGTYLGLAREEACGLEVIDFNFESAVPYLLVQANMTRSKDGETPAGLKRKSRHRVMPLHPELLRLGLEDYVKAVSAEHGFQPDQILPVFPEFYFNEAKRGGHVGKIAPEIGGRRFYKRSWMYIVDAVHEQLPLPEAEDGKKADFHSQRTYNQSMLASPGVSQTIIDRHMGHASQGTGPRDYNRRSLAIGEEQELRERLEVVKKQMPVVTSHVPRAKTVALLHLKHRSRVGSAPGRNAQQRFCE